MVIMDSQNVLDFCNKLFAHYANEKEAREKYFFAKALQNNEQFREDVRREIFSKVEAICSGQDHREQKLAFRKMLLENIKNMAMWQEFLKREGTEESQLIFSFLKDSFKGMNFEEFEKQTAYFQLYSEAQYSILQGILNRFYDEVFENNYSAMLTKVWRMYYEQYFNFIVAQARGDKFHGEESMERLNTILKKVEASALDGEDRVYDMDKI